VTAEQLILFAAESSCEHGPAGLLRAILRQGLDPAALRAAAAICLELDAQAGAGAQEKAA
jgi:hypothetical protein